ncbi:unnamed protein product [Blepharisma stoltei]|uniref:Uncharacterized protein n=1 Tax=Blepharisma stoltei TaxID=1481888 RepID=A0AAU9JKH5_9CILI|nr:unnamed protein product [Blepharisma stoltei]
MEKSLDDEDFDMSIIDTLTRQIAEVKKQIEKAQNVNKTKALELQRAKDQRKARLVLNCLKLKKQVYDLKAFLDENRKQWALDIRERQTTILQYSTYLKQERYLKVKYLSEIEQALIIPTLIQLNLNKNSKLQGIFASIQEEETTGNYIPTLSLEPSEVTQGKIEENEERYLSSHLKAAIEGSQSTEKPEMTNSLQSNVEDIRRDLRRFINKMKSSDLEDGVSYLLKDSVMESISSSSIDLKILDSSKAEKMKLFQAFPSGENISSIQNSKSFGHNSVFSFSNPDFTIPIPEDININGKSVKNRLKIDNDFSSDWKIDNELWAMKFTNQSEDENERKPAVLDSSVHKRKPPRKLKEVVHGSESSEEFSSMYSMSNNNFISYQINDSNEHHEEKHNEEYNGTEQEERHPLSVKCTQTEKTKKSSLKKIFCCFCK